MVWLFSVIAVSNIAMGYGLAVYFHQHFGTAVPSCGTLRKKAAPPSPAPVIVNTPAIDTAVVRETTEPEVAESSGPESVDDAPTAVPAEEIGGLPAVDEENVLAGIEEFRSQLAKMNVTAEDVVAESEIEAVEEELVGAAN